jgi:hypothetical protein
MRMASRSGLAKVGAVSVLAILLAVSGLSARAQGYERYPSRAESPADRTAHHLESLAHRTGPFESGRERSRYDHAIRHLSEFQNRLYQGHFDRDRLDQAINDVQNVVNHNPLDNRARGMLWNDLNDLRAFRATRGYGNGFVR